MAGPAATETKLWHPFAAMGSVRESEFVLVRGEDVWLWDDEGRRYLDGSASLWYANVGHGRPEIADAIAAQLGELETYSIFGDFANPPALELAEHLSSLAPMPEPKVFLTSGGGDSIETAAKLARRYFNEIGEPERVHLISRGDGFHGTHGHGTSLGGIGPNRDGLGPLGMEFSQVDRDSVDALAAEVERLGPERVAAFFTEPILGAGGVRLPPADYLEKAADLCREHGILFVADVVICAFGRLGTWFGIDRWNCRPDMICFAKGVTSGYLPLGGVIIDQRIAEPFWRPGAGAFRHGPTYAGHATCSAAALANLELLESENLLERSRSMEGELVDALAPLSERDDVAEIRGGVGIMAAVEFSPRLLAERPAVAAEVVEDARRSSGVLLRPLGTCIGVSPPLTAGREHYEMIGGAIADGLDAAARNA